MVNLIIVQQDDSQQIRKPIPRKSWGYFFGAMLLVATLPSVVPFFLSTIALAPSPLWQGLLFPISIILLIFNWIFTIIIWPLAFIWVGTITSPADSKKTCIAIGAVLSFIIICLLIITFIFNLSVPNYYPRDFSISVALFLELGIIFLMTRAVHIIADTPDRRIDIKKSWGPLAFHGGISAILAVIMLIVLFMSIMTGSSAMSSRRGAWMSRARGTLRSTGSSQLAYQRTNNSKYYGSIDDLRDNLYIAQGYSLGNMIENYSMTWAVRNDYAGGSGRGIGSNTYTIVAYPRDTLPGYLLTFGITEDQIIRVYNPDTYIPGEKNEFIDINDPRVLTWDPIL